MTISAEELESSGGHYVHLYGTDLGSLARNAGAFLAEGLARRGTILAIVGAANWSVLARDLERRGIDVDAAVRDGSIDVLDAEATLASLMRNGLPDRALFEAAVGDVVRDAHRRDPGVRLYGEMVGILWSDGNGTAAIELEAMWNELLATTPARLFCSYPLDIFGPEFERSNIDGIMCSHTHLLPSDAAGDLSLALRRGMATVLGPEVAESISSLIQPNHRPAWGTVPEAESTILWLRNNLPAHADEITAIARAYFRE